MGGCVNDTFISERIRQYDGDLVWYKLHPDLDRYRRDIASELWIQKKKSKGYDYKDLIMNLFGRRPLDDDSFFCSELAEWAYKRRLPLEAFNEHPQWLTDPEFKIFLSNKTASRPGDIAGLPFLIEQGRLLPPE